ncbi:MAG: iron ABC transporter permease [Candidatus Methanoplasma sp.]|jgi:iron complex transport system permease protein|nr:iron ABC transporter permease [Candidatus Methanoplasma sp.]
MDAEGEDTAFRDGYRRYTARKLLFIACIALGIFIVSGVALTIGGRDIGFFQVYGIALDHLGGATYAQGSSEWWDDYIVWNIRLPRIAMAIVAGAGLAVGGAAMQAVVKNPLADPYTTGISSGAVFGVAVALVLGFSASSGFGGYGLVVNAFLFGLIPAGAIIFISRFSSASPVTIILAGIALSYLFTALSTLLLVTANTETLQQAYLWQIGTLQGAVWSDLPLMAAATLAGSVFMMLSTKKLNLLTLGDDSAKSLGLDAEGFRMLILVALSMMTASVIGFTGIIGFVGLVSPHIMRIFLGSDNRYILPASAMFGALFLLAADLASRMLIYPGEIPVGIVMSFVGGPLFLLLIITSKKGVW